MPRLYNKRKNDYPPDAVYIGRPSPWGNPWRSSRYGREESIRLFEEKTLPTLDVEPLRGKDLVCWCWPKPCHGQSILRKLRETR